MGAPVGHPDFVRAHAEDGHEHQPSDATTVEGKDRWAVSPSLDVTATVVGTSLHCLAGSNNTPMRGGPGCAASPTLTTHNPHLAVLREIKIINVPKRGTFSLELLCLPG